MVTFMLIAFIFTIIVVGLLMHHRTMEAVRERMQYLENTVASQESEKKRMQGRLEACDKKVKDLEQQLEESEKARMELATKLREEQ